MTMTQRSIRTSTISRSQGDGSGAREGAVMSKRTLITIIGLVVVVVVVVGSYMLSPLFIDRVVDEKFPLALPSPEQLAKMPENERKALETKMMEAAAKMPDKAMDDAMPAMDTKPVVVAQGQLKDADSFHKGSGSATIYQLPDGSHVLRFENFRVTNGPALHVLLAHHPMPASRSDVKPGYMDLGSLKGNIGSQNYPISAGTDLAPFKSVVIYCMPFHVVFATASLN